MKTMFAALIITILTSLTPLFSQGTRTVSTERIRSILKDLSELDQLRKDKAVDSVTIVRYDSAIHTLRDALGQCNEAIRQGNVIAQGDRALLEEAKRTLMQAGKEVRRQKTLKWLGFGLSAIFAWLAIEK